MNRHPMAIAWDEWLKTREGEKCQIGTAEGFYLKNRLWYAFQAGYDYGKKDASSAAIRRTIKGESMNVNNQAIITCDKVAEDAHTIFQWRVAVYKGKKQMDYKAEARASIAAAEAFVDVGILSGHIKIESVK